MNPVFWKISVEKCILQRHLKNLASDTRFAAGRQEEKLPNVVFSHSGNMIKRAPGVDPVTQENKADNIRLAGSKMNGLIIKPGEEFSFWKMVGKTTERRGFKTGRVLVNNELQTGIGGGLCNLANTIHLLVLHSPLEVTEFHNHSDALAPDEHGRIPFSAGTSVNYNYVDYRFKNTTDQNVQLLVWCEGDTLYAELRSETEFPWSYQIVEENHHFHREGEKFYRVSQIYKVAADKSTGEVVEKTLVLDNHSEVMFDYNLIPKEQIREY